MKNLVGLVLVLLFALESQAQLKKTYQRVKQAVTGSAKLAQLHYFPEQWEVDLSLGYRYSILDIKGNSAGITVVEAEQKQHLLTSSLTFGVLDNAYVQLSWDYLAQMDVSYSKPVNEPSTKSKGVEDPVMAAVVRLVDGDSVKIDAKVAFQPSSGDHQQADSANDGDAKSGGHATTFGARIVALATESSQLAAAVEYRMLSVQNSVDQSSKAVTEDEKHNQMLFELATLTELTSELYFGLTLEIANTDSYKSTDLSDNSSTDYGPLSLKALNLVGKYAFTPDNLVDLQVGYLIDYSQEVATVDFSATSYTVAAQYLIRF